ncbi:peptidase C2 [Siculibacillus lacustris]|uniref:Peptidase C2 n=1 Tax=Siculibacillus lacustris TaxID=1549641 RepID=A0A4Q9VVD6_9HYPH|nr:C2 family cysteine protease [Siculibacillus lacustris]TBW38998.1 peptidase C2 [Siculibacillus lacustris]
MSYMFAKFDRQKSAKSTDLGSSSSEETLLDLADGLISSQPARGVDALASAVTVADGSAFGFGLAVAATTTTLKTTTPSVVTASTTPTATATPTATKLPAWVSSIKTAAIQSDVATAVADGTITYAELVKVFSDVASSLTSAKSTLSATQFADLKTLVADLANGVSTSAYLTALAGSLVGGSKANATWTGGAATSVALGNLAAGSTATQLNELIGKWFLGSDLPASRFTLSGYGTYTVSYSAVSKPLFASSGPTMNDVNQGFIGDCFLLASLAEVADQNSSLIKSMFTDNGNGSYGVKFYVNGSATWVTVNTSLANGGTIFNYCGTDVWASLAEKAYAELQTSGTVTGNIYNYGNSWTTIGNGGAPEYALEEITGASQITDFCSAKGSWTCNVYNSSLSRVGYSAGLSNASVLNTLIADIAAGDDVVLSSYTNARDSSGKTTLVAGHAMSIYGWDGATGLLQVRNPWGTEPGQTWATTFEVSLATLLAAGDVITVDNVGAGTMATTKTSSTGTTSTVKAVADLAGGATDPTVGISLEATATLFAQSIASVTSGTSSTAMVAMSLTSVTTSTLASPLG